MYVHWIHDLSQSNDPLVGGKCANLGRLSRLGVPVPKGFCVDLYGYRDFLLTTDIGKAVDRFLREIDSGNLQQLYSKCFELQDSFRGAEIPCSVADSVSEAYYELVGHMGSTSAVAVRSSATAEDMLTASFAGQYDSYLGVRSEADLLESIVKCWASLWNPQAVQYRRLSGIDHSTVEMSVVVQDLVKFAYSGVLFTGNPVSGDLSEAVINSTWGLAEGLVTGIVVPDTFVVDKVSREVKTRNISRKETFIELAEETGTQESPVQFIDQQKPSLTDTQIKELLELVAMIESHYGYPLDIEWGHDGKQFFIVQTRPITGLAASNS